MPRRAKCNIVMRGLELQRVKKKKCEPREKASCNQELKRASRRRHRANDLRRYRAKPHIKESDQFCETHISLFLFIYYFCVCVCVCLLVLSQQTLGTICIHCLSARFSGKVSSSCLLCTYSSKVTQVIILC